MPDRSKVLIAEGHALFRSALRALLAMEPELEIVGEAGTYAELLQAAAQLSPDIVVMDISMAGVDSMDTIATIKRRAPGTRIIVVTMQKADEDIHEALNAGADAYVLKDAEYEELQRAIRAVRIGKVFLTPYVSSRVITGLLAAHRLTSLSLPVHVLTRRERQVLKLVAEGHDTRRIASFISLSDKTVAKHRSNLMRKLNLHCVADLTRFAMENGLLANSPA